MSQNALNSTLVLCKLKLRLLGNSFKSWASVGKLIGVGFGIIFTAVAVTSGSAEMLDSLRQIPYAELILDWLMAAIVVYGIFMVFTGDLITGHTIGAGQMSQDFTFLCTLPVPPLSLILVKLFERLVSDYLGVIILFSAFLGINCRDGVTIEGILLSIILFIQISLLIGLGINLVLIILKRFFRTATINNFFSLLSYLSAFLTIVPYLIFSSFPVEALAWIFENLELLNATVFRFMVPAKWLGICLISKSFCDEFFFFTGFWALLMLAGTGFFYLGIRLNWLHYSHSTAQRATSKSTRWFTGFMQKEVTLITSDYNMAINAILMPISIIVVEIYFLKQFLSVSSQTSMLNIIFGAVIYFCMFGPMNAIGSEGKAIAALETMPIAPSEIMQRKFMFWLLIAETIFMTATAVTLQLFNYNLQATLNSVMVTAVFTAACVWTSISISAIFAVFDSKMLQQSSTFAGKIAALGVMLLAAPIKSLSWLNAANTVIFACIGLLLYMKAKIYLFYRLDQQSQHSATHRRLDLLLLFFAFAGGNMAVTQFFLAVIPGYDTGLWAWALPIIILSPVLAIYFMSQRDPVADQQNMISHTNWFMFFITGAGILGSNYLLSLKAPDTVSYLKENLGAFVGLGSTIFSYFGLAGTTSELVLQKVTALAFILLSFIITWFVALLTGRFFLGCDQPRQKNLYRLIAVTAPTLLVPWQLLPTSLTIFIGLAVINRRRHQEISGALLIALCSAIIMAWLLFS